MYLEEWKRLDRSCPYLLRCVQDRPSLAVKRYVQKYFGEWPSVVGYNGSIMAYAVMVGDRLVYVGDENIEQEMAA